MDNKKKVELILLRLGKLYSGGTTKLKYRNKMQLLVAVILSAQCTDKQVNIVTKELFKKYKTPKDFADADSSTLQKEIRSTGFFRAKTRNIIGSGKKIVQDYADRIPQTMEELLTLPGVARKTANIILSAGFGKHEGIAVDTHVIRLSNLLGLTKHKDPVKIEQDLLKVTPKGKAYWDISTLLIYHGRDVCIANRPKCEECVLNDFCPGSRV